MGDCNPVILSPRQVEHEIKLEGILGQGGFGTVCTASVAWLRTLLQSESATAHMVLAATISRIDLSLLTLGSMDSVKFAILEYQRPDSVECRHKAASEPIRLGL